MSFIKSFFAKELDSILAPLDKIHSQLDSFLDRAAQDIADNIKKISEIQLLNEAKAEEQKIAIKVKDNIKTLLGKM